MILTALDVKFIHFSDWTQVISLFIRKVCHRGTHLNENSSPLHWENIFTEEALLVEELVASGDFAFLNQSKIRIALENKILSWEKYTAWIQNTNEYLSLGSDLNELQIKKLQQKYEENKKTFSHYGIWSNDLIAVEMWDEQLIILGLMPTEKLLSIANAIFVLCPFEILNQIIKTGQTDEMAIDSETNSEKSSITKTTNLLEFDPFITKPTELNFSSITADLQKTDPKFESTAPHPETTQTAFSIWNLVDKNHLENTDSARKNFDAFVILKIIDDQTRVYKMDDDLAKEEINQGLFIYNLKTDNPFSKVFKSQTTQSVNLSELGLVILDFKYASITPMKLGNEILGFYVGFKISETSADDENTLEDISFKNAA